jgi:acetolactate synthase regulatory subunit
LQEFEIVNRKSKIGNRFGDNMNTFTIRYRNTQGTLMRILNAASRRGLDIPYVHAEAAEHDHQATLILDVNQKQVGQLYREWYAIPDVIKVASGTAQAAEWTSAHPPSGVAIDGLRPAARA